MVIDVGFVLRVQEVAKVFPRRLGIRGGGRLKPMKEHRQLFFSPLDAKMRGSRQVPASAIGQFGDDFRRIDAQLIEQLARLRVKDFIQEITRQRMRMR